MTEAAADGSAPTNVRTFRRSQLVVLLAITLVAVGLRFFRLGEWSFWVDEAHTFRDVASTPEQFWRSNVSNYPLGYLLLDFLLDVGLLQGTTEGWLRLPFAFFGIVTVPALALFGRSVVGRRASLLAAAFLAISPWHIYWSQNARAYSMAVFFALIAAFAVHRAAHYRSIWLGVVAIVGTMLAGLSHPSGLLMMFALVLFAATEVVRDPNLRRAFSRPWVLASITGAAVFLLAWALPTVLHHAEEEKPNFSIVHLTQTFAWFIGPSFVVTSIGGACVMALRARQRETLFLLSWIVGPSVALVLIGATMMKVTAQYGLIFLPAILLLTSRLIVELADAITERGRTAQLLRWSLPFVLLGSLGSDTILYYLKRHGDRPRFRDAANFVLADSDGPREVWSSNEPTMRYYLDRGYYSGESNHDTRVEGISDWRFRDAGGGGAWFGEVVADARGAGRDLYFVVTEPELQEWDRDGSFDAALRAGAAQLRRYPCWTGPKDMVVLVYKVATATPAEPR